MPDPLAQFAVLGVPQPKGSWRAFINRATGKPGLKPDGHHKPWQQAVAWAALQAHGGQALLEGAVAVTILFVLPRPKSISQPRRPEPKVKPDLDKLERAILDGLTGAVIRDDAQVCELTTRKVYDDDAPSVGAFVRVGRPREIESWLQTQDIRLSELLGSLWSSERERASNVLVRSDRKGAGGRRQGVASN